MTTVPDRLRDHKAERAVLGACLIDPDAILRLDFLEPGDFHDEAHGWIYEAMRDLADQHAPMDIVTVGNALDGRLASVGGRAYLTDLVNTTPSSMRAVHYAKAVSRLATLRRLMKAAADIASLAYNSENTELDDVFARARQMVDAIAPENGNDAILQWLDSIDAFLGGQLDRLMELDAVEKGDGAPPIQMPWRAFERFKVRLRPGTLAIVVAGSGVGKTTFLECCAEYWARQGQRVVFFHLELAHQLMLDRRMARLTGIPLDKIEDGEMDSRVELVNADLRQYPGGITYVHCPGWSAGRIAQQARQLWNRGLCDVAIVDYLQKMRLTYRQGANKADALGETAEILKVAGEKLGIPFVLASQFNRAVEYTSRKTGAYIRGSGEPHEKANLVITLDRPILEKDATDEGGRTVMRAGERSPQVTVRVDKYTAGPTGETELIMNPARFLILDKYSDVTAARLEVSDVATT